MDDAELTRRLERFLAARLGAGTRITRLGRSTEGFSQETFTLDVDVAGASHGYVVKREPVAGLLEPYDLEPEFRVLHALSDDPLPSPPTPWFEADPEVLERSFYVMERLAGDVPIPAPGPDGAGPFADAERAMLGPQVVSALALLHAFDWRARDLGFLGDPGVGTAPGVREIAIWEARIGRSGFACPPMLAAGLSWLRRHVPVTDDVTLVHGDYRLGNFLVTRAGDAAHLSGVLDWEMVHLGDPLEDVGWCTSALWRAGTPLASCLMEPEEFAAAYARVSGRAVDAERVRFWEVLAIVKMAAIMLTGLRAFADGRTSDLRMAIFDHQLPFLELLLAMTIGSA